MNFARLLLLRLGLAVPLVIGASFITFSILYLVPGDPVVMMAGDRSNDRELVEKLREELRLNDPFLVRYGRFLGGILTLDLGRSYRTNRRITDDLVEALPASAELALAGVLFAVALGVTSGVVSALRKGTVMDYGFMVVALVGMSVPVFWLGLIINYLFGFRWPLFEMSGRLGGEYFGYAPRTGFVFLDAILQRDGALFLNALSHLVLPAATLGLIGAAVIARMTRSSVLEAREQDFVRTARSKGLRPSGVNWHILRNAVMPVVTVVGLQLGALLGGAIMTEEIFAWPGMGTYLIQAVRYRDFIAVQGTVMAFVLLFVLVNLVVDISYYLLDPRVRSRHAA